MRISAIQKTTLLDYPGHIACTVFLPGCNLRCPFCHNAALVLPRQDTPPEVPLSELFSFLQKRRGKLDGVCITGGEPTLQPDLPRLIRDIRELGFAVKLDTNGTNPKMLADLLESGLPDYVAMDIKNSPRRYRETCGVDVLDAVSESIRLLLGSSIDYEFRTTVCSPLHTPADMTEIGRWIHGAKRYFIQPFVDSGDLVGTGMQPLTKDELLALHAAALTQIPVAQLRGI